MSTLQKLSITTIGAALLTFGLIAPAAAVSSYAVTELPFTPSDINDVGQVVGEKYLWNNDTLTDLSTLPGADTNSISANAINNNGLIVGSGGSFNTSQAFISDSITITYIPSAFCASDGVSCESFSAYGFLLTPISANDSE